MKNLTLLLLLAACRLAAQDFSDPAIFNDYLTEHQYKVEGKLTECNLLSIHQEQSPEKLAACQQAYQNLLRQTVKNIESMPKQAETSTLQDKAADYFRIRLELATTNYTDLINTSIDSLSFEAIQRYLDLDAAQHSKLEKAHALFTVEQEEFARKHGFRLSMNDTAAALENKIKVVNRATDYYNRVHYNCLKILRALGNFSEALNASEGAQAEFWRVRLAEDCKAAQSRLEQMQPYLSDAALLDKAHKFLRCQQALAEREFQAITLFLTKFDKVEPASQEEVNAYNAAVLGYNEALEKMNALLVPLANELQTEGSEFLRRHTPKN